MRTASSVAREIKTANNIDIQKWEGVLSEESSAEVVEEILKGLSYRGINSEYLENYVISILQDNLWPGDDCLKIAALSALSTSRKHGFDYRDILKKLMNMEDVVLRDAAMVAAQRLCGVKDRDIIWGSGEGDMSARIPKDILSWLSGGG